MIGGVPTCQLRDRGVHSCGPRVFMGSVHVSSSYAINVRLRAKMLLRTTPPVRGKMPSSSSPRFSFSKEDVSFSKEDVIDMNIYYL